MNTRFSRYQRGLGRAAAALIAIMLGLGGAAAIALWPTGGTNAPTLEAPADGTVIYGSQTGAPVTLEWRHGYGSLDNRNPRRVSHFVICVLNAPPQVCAWPGTFPAGDPRLPMHVWTESATVLTRVGTAATSILERFRLLNPALDAPYQYSFSPAGGIPASGFGQALDWTVGACNSQANTGCRYADTRQIAFAGTTNLAATDKSDSLVGDTLTIDGLAKNTGTFDSGEFRTTIRLWQVMLGPDNQVRTDLNSSEFNDDTLVLFRDGSKRARSQAPQTSPGIYDESAIWGILLAGGTDYYEEDTHPGLEPGTELSVAQIVHRVQSRPARYVISFTVDARRVLPETDENDNTYSKLTDLIQ
ncbi:MAG: hypothetical protein ACT4UP_03400 [Gammaproteobacteria bacterium]